MLQHQQHLAIVLAILTVFHVRNDEDGEGLDAGFGVAVRGGAPEAPLAGFLQLPHEIRMLWTEQRVNDGTNMQDMFELEAIGPVGSGSPRISLWILQSSGRGMTGLRRSMGQSFEDGRSGQKSLIVKRTRPTTRPNSAK